MFSTKLISFSLLLVLALVSECKAQSFGFGCLGFVGGYGGFSYQKYDPAGLNKYVNAFNAENKDSLQSSMAKFGEAQGYRIGINIFRANFKGFILTTKGFYQYLSEKNSASINANDGLSTTVYDVELKNWGFGVDLGTSLTDMLSWKVIDAAILYNTASFTNTKNFPGSVTTLTKYNSEKYTLGYSIGTGFILQLIGRYISLEGAAGYASFKINRMRTDGGKQLTVSETSKTTMQDFVTSGGFNAVVQLNVGFPL